VGRPETRRVRRRLPRDDVGDRPEPAPRWLQWPMHLGGPVRPLITSPHGSGSERTGRPCTGPKLVKDSQKLVNDSRKLVKDSQKMVKDSQWY
jgi:hypothetical protein